jgi:protein-tyrosine phosphatase
MFLFSSKKTIVESGFLRHFIDYHSHILPGVDDGIKTFNESLQILNQYEQWGVEQVVFTPHIMEEYALNQPAFLKEQYSIFCDQYQGKISLRLGGEYMIDGGFSNHLQNGEMLTIKDHHILVEASYAFEPPGFLGLIREAKDKGYQVVLAHPERYSFMTKGLHRQIKQLDVLFQLNLPSLFGYYGSKAAQNAKEFLERNEYSFIGSDIHRVESLKTIFQTKGLNASLFKGLTSNV